MLNTELLLPKGGDSMTRNLSYEELETLYAYVEYLEDMFGNHYDAFIDAGLDPYRTNEDVEVTV